MAQIPLDLDAPNRDVVNLKPYGACCPLARGSGDMACAACRNRIPAASRDARAALIRKARDTQP